MLQISRKTGIATLLTATLLAALLVTAMAGGADRTRPLRHVWVFQIKSDTNPQVAGLIPLCSANGRVMVSGVIAGLKVGAPYKLQLARTARSLKLGRSKTLVRFTTDAVGIARIPTTVAFKPAIKPGTTALALVPDDDEGSDVDESAEVAIEESLSGSQPSDPDPECTPPKKS